MAKIVLKNPYFEEEIKVKESCKRIADMLGYIERGNMDYLQLQQIEPTETIITINPKHFAKIEFYEEGGRMLPKFRAWDKEFKEMVQVDALLLDEQAIKATYKNGSVTKEDIKNYVLMQSTGIFDKNGKEIFEGDIIANTNVDFIVDIRLHKTLGFYSLIDGKECFLGNGTSAEKLEKEVEEFSGNTEVIGNIYENPELLENKGE